MGTNSGDERESGGKKRKKYGQEENIWGKKYGSSKKQIYVYDGERRRMHTANDFPFTVCIPKKDSAKPHFQYQLNISKTEV